MRPLTRRTLLMGTGIAAVGQSSLAQRTTSRPNILFLATDQQTQSALSAHGNPFVKTPAMDSLVSGGVSFCRSYSPYPVCSPARSSWWTGLMPHQTGVRKNNEQITPGIPTAGELFRRSGYDTVYGGKWHLGKEPVGFRVIAGHANLAAVMDQPLASACVRFLESKPKEPFLLAASFLNPHDICQWIRDNAASHSDPQTSEYPPARLNMAADPDEPEYMQYHRTAGYNLMSQGVGIASHWNRDDFRRYLNAYYRFVEKADRQIARILDALKRSGLEQNTIIVFTADHGEGLGSHRWVQKAAFYEESAKVPLIFAGPGISRRGIRDEQTLVSGIDILPTLCDLAGIAAPPVTGLSLRGVLNGGNLNRDFVVSELSEYGKPDRQGRMVRSERYKYVVFNGGARPEQLFDLELDPGEILNLASQSSAAPVLREHRQKLRQWIKQTNDDFVSSLI